ncbi:MAG TPA: 2-methylcitrate dehydratase, partial [Nitrosospira sp.]|nr:2-methylcitrate dehydratase [Nitrosospira sp.]
PKFTQDYYDPEKRSIANGLTVEFKDGSSLDEVAVEYPIGHRLRRREGMPFLEDKFSVNLARRFPEGRQQSIIDLCLDQQQLESTPVNEFVDMFAV